MASFTAPAGASNEQTFTAMDVGDVEAAGKHCAFCRQLDFLPFKCYSCGYVFCNEHKTETGHLCTKAGEFERRRKQNANAYAANSAALTKKPNLDNSRQCSEPSCKTFIDTSQNLGVQCETCNRRYCMAHRFQNQHDCKNLIPLGARPMDLALQANKEKLRVGFGRLKLWSKEKQQELKPKPKPTSKAAQMAALNKLKASAKGDDKIPLDKRVYLHCTTPELVGKAKEPKKKDLFFNSDWVVGRLLDVAARELGTENKNNMVEEDDPRRLWIYVIETAEIIDPATPDKVGQKLQSGQSISLARGLMET